MSVRSPTTQNVTQAVEAVLNVLGKPGGEACIQYMKKEFGINVKNLNSESLFTFEFALRHTFGFGGHLLVKLLTSELEKQ